MNKEQLEEKILQLFDNFRFMPPKSPSRPAAIAIIQSYSRDYKALTGEYINLEEVRKRLQK